VWPWVPLTHEHRGLHCREVPAHILRVLRRYRDVVTCANPQTPSRCRLGTLLRPEGAHCCRLLGGQRRRAVEDLVARGPVHQVQVCFPDRLGELPATRRDREPRDAIVRYLAVCTLVRKYQPAAWSPSQYRYLPPARGAHPLPTWQHPGVLTPCLRISAYYKELSHY